MVHDSSLFLERFCKSCISIKVIFFFKLLLLYLSLIIVTDGRTGVPFVDANMRELKETGWMSNRGRQNVASFLLKDLGLDWRLGAEWFESQLVSLFYFFIGLNIKPLPLGRCYIHLCIEFFFFHHIVILL